MKQVVVYVHGKGGSSEEANHYKSLFKNSDVIGYDYKSTTPWDAKKEFKEYFDTLKEKYDFVILLANSIGAFFSMSSLTKEQIDVAFLISPIVDMEKLIYNMMKWANVTENELSLKKEIVTNFNEVLSYDYLCYVRDNPIKWDVKTNILYGEFDHLTSLETISSFAKRINATLEIMKGGEHWFHTEEEMKFLDSWILKISWL